MLAYPLSIQPRPMLSPPFLVSKHALIPLAPPQRLIHVTAATLSPSITTGYPTDAGVSPVISSITHAVTTIASSDRRFVVTEQRIGLPF